MKNPLIILMGLLFLAALPGFSQAIYEDERYVPETDPLVLEKLSQWQDIKFGLLMHWGAYSQWGIVESWSICAEDEGWCRRPDEDYTAYKKRYERLQTTFNPVKFNPERWAKAAKDAGMKYVVFTTKHHDGFCMFDSKYTDYKVTSPACPFSTHPKANIAKNVFDAFRDEGMWVGAYFSKPDWHHKDYWSPEFATPDRNVNYDPAAYPDRWENFVQFTHNQIMELMSDYGKMDILWLDGGWVAKKEKDVILKAYARRLENSSTGFIKAQVINQDIRMDELAAKARVKQPGLIVVDRAVHGKNQNYLTPENRVPEATLPYPWESCIISGGGWSYTPDAKYMTGRQAIHMLIDIVAKGGNLLYNIAPGPDGEWQQGAYDLLKEMGTWIKVNGEAIYNSKPLYPYKEDKIAMTQQKDGSANFLYLASEGEKMPSKIVIRSHKPVSGAEVTLLGSDQALKWKAEDDGFVVNIPAKQRNNPPCDLAWTLRVSQIVR
ncbi:alpha-L-fucosidase [Saccharicrinis carchari]|uniref:alpha-L-fucosidase n=1 Tax=Saccharicrinis carchari TaxID=1168039 RepID=A0A521BZP6_SACCC|nr:alpha-L-fucosidase [Saccharicrinis carchari]SMO51940.1 alpha-L-fucosidase [Saccharicrinis carchari]